MPLSRYLKTNQQVLRVSLGVSGTWAPRCGLPGGGCPQAEAGQVGWRPGAAVGSSPSCGSPSYEGRVGEAERHVQTPPPKERTGQQGRKGVRQARPPRRPPSTDAGAEPRSLRSRMPPPITAGPAHATGPAPPSRRPEPPRGVKTAATCPRGAGTPGNAGRSLRGGGGASPGSDLDPRVVPLHPPCPRQSCHVSRRQNLPWLEGRARARLAVPRSDL